MTKKDYEPIAQVMKSHRELAQANGGVLAQEFVTSIVAGLVLTFSDSNPKFDTDKFLSACGIETAWNQAKTYNQKVGAFVSEIKSGKYE